MDIAEHLADLFARHGAQAYGEAVTQMDHAVQTAALAARDNKPASVVAAALLHDIGHFLSPAPEAFGAADHAERGAAFLSHWFDKDVTGPVRLHVAAKRYLCATQPGYYDRLSAASQHTLAQQGGPFSKAECTMFEAQNGAQAAVYLRRCDDNGKIEGLVIEPFNHFLPLIRSVQKRTEPAWDVVKSCA